MANNINWNEIYANADPLYKNKINEEKITNSITANKTYLPSSLTWDEVARVADKWNDISTNIDTTWVSTPSMDSITSTGAAWISTPSTGSITSTSIGGSISIPDYDKKIEDLQRINEILQCQVDELNAKYKQLDALCHILIEQIEMN